MTTYAALLRSVDVGKNKLAMTDLRALLSDLGGEQVRTYLAERQRRLRPLRD
ncbi:DUF1697 domain-containing protein [Jatrophihabitans sp.]|jgi:uncharacterized protein (DUF1697 family)|uniref:DUF1697 domain-containing protein n=1 Tax=Jatrophihabitans sp. TaxID=1932789 RepID=UPI002EF1822C